VIETISRDADASRFRFRWTPTDAQAGEHRFNLTPTDEHGLSGTASEWLLRVDRPPIPNLVANCDGRTCHFDASNSVDDEGITKYAWEFGDGATSDEVKPTHTYEKDDDFTVRLTVTDTRDQTGTATRVLHIGSETPENHPPVAHIDGPEQGKAGAALDFSTSATDPDNDTPLECAIKFSDVAGSDFTPLSNCGAGVTHTFAAPGTYTVTLRARDPGGLTGEATHTVHVEENGPPPACSPDNHAPSLQLVALYSRQAVEVVTEGVPVAEMLRFSFRDADCGPWRARIDWGDQVVNDFPISADHGPGLYNTFHKYAASGRYTIRMTITDADGKGLTSAERTLTADVTVP
jgi:PKD repeat protein